jgi:hypothetical protein
MRRWIALLIVAGLLLEATAGAAVRGKAAKYVGGTLTGLAENTDGTFELGDTAAVFKAKKGATIAIPYKQIDSLEYGQKAGRRLGLALTVSILFIFSKKRKHFLTINFDDEAGKKQGAVFELSKGIVRGTLTTLETQSGKKVEYESDEARKHAEKR